VPYAHFPYAHAGTRAQAIARSHKGEILVRRNPGDIMGEVMFHAFGNRGASCDVVASSRITTVRRIKGEMMDEWTAQDPMKAARLNRFLARAMSLRVRKMVRDAAMFMDT
jgi:CRP-like cAMP-binding protein